MASILIRGATETGKGLVKRSVREEMLLRERILRGRHVTDVLSKLQDELSDRQYSVGPVDMSRNLLRSWVGRRNRAYVVPAFVDELPEAFARVVGDQSAATTIKRYGKLGGRPLPTRIQATSQKALDLRLACNYAGTLLAWSERTQRPYAEPIDPSALKVDYFGDDPMAPTVITHYRRRVIDGREVDVSEVYDLTDEDAPSYTIYDGDRDVTVAALGELPGPLGWSPLWRYEDDRPFHRIIISGDPREPYMGVELIEATLSTCVAWTCWRAGTRDAGFPKTHAIGLVLVGQDSDTETGQTGMSVGPTDVVRWAHANPEQPGNLVQHGPGFDPEVVGRSNRIYETSILSALGMPVDLEATGGEPTETERRLMAELTAQTYPECRGHDGLVMRRMAAMHNRASELTEGMAPAGLPERAYPTLYGEEIGEALAEAAEAEARAAEEAARATEAAAALAAKMKAEMSDEAAAAAKAAKLAKPDEQTKPDTGGTSG